MAQDALVRLGWDTNNMIDMEAATRAQSQVVFGYIAVLAAPDTLTACLGDNGLDVLLNMGLFVIPSGLL
jgi:hypothetical protein